MKKFGPSFPLWVMLTLLFCLQLFILFDKSYGAGDPPRQQKMGLSEDRITLFCSDGIHRFIEPDELAALDRAPCDLFVLDESNNWVRKSGLPEVTKRRKYTDTKVWKHQEAWDVLGSAPKEFIDYVITLNLPDEDAIRNEWRLCFDAKLGELRIPKKGAR